MDASSGTMSGWDETDIADAAGWDGDEKEFVEAMIEANFIEKDSDGNYFIHGWCEHQSWACGAEDRSKAAKAAAKARWDRRTGKADSKQPAQDEQCEVDADCMQGACGEHTEGNAPSPSPSPSPLPSLKEGEQSSLTPEKKKAFSWKDHRPSYASEQDWEDYMAHRKKKKAAMTERAHTATMKQIDLSIDRGFTFSEIVDEVTNRGWAGFKDEWMKKADQQQQRGYETEKQKNQRINAEKLTELLKRKNNAGNTETRERGRVHPSGFLDVPRERP
jgi:hypothetical protein